MNYEKIKTMYAEKSSYLEVKQYLQQAYRLAVKLVESVPDETIYEIMESKDQFAEHIWVNLDDLIVSFYNLSTDEAIDLEVKIDFQDEINDVYAKLKYFKLNLISITLYMPRKSSDVVFYMDEDLDFGDLLGTFCAVFGKNLVAYSEMDSKFTVNSEVFE